MVKRICLMGVSLTVVLVMTALSGAVSAQAALSLDCYEISEYHYLTKAGQYYDALCKDAAIGELNARYILATPEKATTGNLWCAKIDLKDANSNAQTDGYYTNSECKTVLTGSEENESDWTEVEVLKANNGAMTLPSWSVGGSFTGTSGAGELSNPSAKESISCTSGTNKGGTESSLKLGTFAIEFKGCTAEALGSKVKCNSEGDATEVILTVGTWHLVLKIYLNTDQRDMWFLVQPIAIKCTSLVTIEVKGNVLGEIYGLSSTKYGIVVNAPSGAQEITTFENDSGENVATGLESNLNKGSFSAATEESKENTIKTSTETELIN